MSYYGWHAYVPVAEKRRQAERKLAKLKKQGRSVAPVRIEGRTITKSFWGKSWCVNLERYSDYENRLPRGRTYVRNGSVIDLQIAKGEISAMVAGSELYQIKIAIAPVTRARWKSICRDCAGTVDSLVELLQGRLAKGVMDRVCREGDGLFPSPTEIKLSCSCPDWADMCKHVAAALYGVGARLDEKPQLLFVLRDVDENEMLASAGQDSPLTRRRQARRRCLMKAMSLLYSGWRWLKLPIPQILPSQSQSDPNSPRRKKEARYLPERRSQQRRPMSPYIVRTRASSGTKKTTRASARKRRTRGRP